MSDPFHPGIWGGVRFRGNLDKLGGPAPAPPSAPASSSAPAPRPARVVWRVKGARKGARLFVGTYCQTCAGGKPPRTR